jgi:hypothetical protein
MNITRITVRKQAGDIANTEQTASHSLALVISPDDKTVVINDKICEATPKDLDDLDLIITSLGEVAQRIIGKGVEPFSVDMDNPETIEEIVPARDDVDYDNPTSIRIGFDRDADTE